LGLLSLLLELFIILLEKEIFAFSFPKYFKKIQLLKVFIENTLKKMQHFKDVFNQ